MPRSGVAAPTEGRQDRARSAGSGIGADRFAPPASHGPVRASRAADAVDGERWERLDRWAVADGSEVADRRDVADRIAGGVPNAAGRRDAARSTASPARDATPERRTVTIRGRGAERYVPRSSSASRRRPERRYERSGFRPDRTALWAVLLGLLLILAAAASAHAAAVQAAAHLH